MLFLQFYYFTVLLPVALLLFAAYWVRIWQSCEDACWTQNSKQAGC